MTDSQAGATLAISEAVTEFMSKPLEATVARVAKQCLLDWFAVTLAGAKEPVTDVLVEELAQSNAKIALIGRREKADFLNAILINGTAGHALDYDDVNSAMLGHPTVPVAPVVFALAEDLGTSGETALKAFVAGYETECCVGRYIGQSHYLKGFHGTGTLGTFGAAATASALLGLSAEKTAEALSLAATQAAGLKSMFGTFAKPMHAGKAAYNGALAARLVARGFQSRTDAIECNQGFVQTQSDNGSAKTCDLSSFGRNILKTNFKYHAACYATHSSIEAALLYRKDHKLGDNDTVEVHVPKMAMDMCNILDPEKALETKFSLRQVIAMVMADIDTSSLENFSDGMACNERIKHLRNRVTVYGDNQAPGSPARLLVHSGGKTIEINHDATIPLTDLNMQEEKLVAKFHSIVSPILDRNASEFLESAVRDLDTLESTHQIMNATSSTL